MPRTLEQAIEARSSVSTVAADIDSLERAARVRRTVHGLGRLLLQAIVFVALVSLFFFRVPQVDGRSMLPSIEGGNHILISTLAYGIAVGPWILTSKPIRRGDIVAFERGRGDDRKIFLKRVIALPGETVSIGNGIVAVRGAPLREAYNAITDHADMRSISVPLGTVFVLGDNRAQSVDSRAFGPIPQTSIVGKAVFVIWPLGHVQRIR